MQVNLKSFALLAMVAATAATAQEKSEVQVSPEVAAKCEAEGGCMLISRARMTTAMRDVYQGGVEEGRKQAQAAGKTCRKDI